MTSNSEKSRDPQIKMFSLWQCRKILQETIPLGSSAYLPRLQRRLFFFASTILFFGNSSAEFKGKAELAHCSPKPGNSHPEFLDVALSALNFLHFSHTGLHPVLFDFAPSALGHSRRNPQSIRQFGGHNGEPNLSIPGSD